MNLPDEFLRKISDFPGSPDASFTMFAVVSPIGDYHSHRTALAFDDLNLEVLFVRVRMNTLAFDQTEKMVCHIREYPLALLHDWTSEEEEAAQREGEVEAADLTFSISSMFFIRSTSFR